MKQNAHVIVPQSRFRLLRGRGYADAIHVQHAPGQAPILQNMRGAGLLHPAQHPDGYAITVACVDPAAITSVTTNSFDGQNWETSFEASNMASYSRE
ncbi:hypothetical protein Pcac1_g9138 [Phytophthora cactorum]|nr:hypothetical protein Pcac1_g9138 [Phytophthora cactorum]